jgi:anti-sigma factor RsiW
LHDSQTCQGVQHDLEAYLDGSVSTLRVQQIEGHLDGCTECLAQLHLAKEIQNELRALPEFDAPAPVIHSIYDQTVRSGRSAASLGRFAERWLRPAWATLALAGLALVLALTLMHRAPVAPDQPDEAAIAQATAEARFALSRVGLATRKVGTTVRDRAWRDGIVVPTRESLSGALGRQPLDESESVNQGVNDV